MRHNEKLYPALLTVCVMQKTLSDTIPCSFLHPTTEINDKTDKTLFTILGLQ